ncbi:hypothetical protein AC629_06880 [Bradyrhizobium sp. NAS80.1]|nr:hypothetical protein AC629_06880 [Bradyrhizobium sp. NAS80.1]
MRGDDIALFFKREVSCIQQFEVCFRQVPPIRLAIEDLEPINVDSAVVRHTYLLVRALQDMWF